MEGGALHGVDAIYVKQTWDTKREQTWRDGRKVDLLHEHCTPSAVRCLSDDVRVSVGILDAKADVGPAEQGGDCRV